ncbi:deoxyribose-phosphate aldolase [Erysipelothrix sp. HDW6C]|uniref:deoxyribose-phosphate aldolase n=1 Tax=Erysipelothrix sp. HDW6C TaxID=2714930 RepID=UPI001407A0A0|nr:deoxyribose-phosphate aldolase [Erysipelothrix sp. HDW6C]QIK70180.1 deoxyribose-phosphate aldolase [Erysipelothrix sp. HDW6C]
MELNRYIDHTLLKPEATQAQIKALCEEAIKYNFKSVCINPTHVELAASLLKGTGVEVCTVVGFPLGATPTVVKEFETKTVLALGATEVDMVINVGALKEGRTQFVEDEIRALKTIVGDKILKVIIETCLLTPEEIATVSQLVVNAGADFVKTSTGFSSGGARAEDVAIMKQTVGNRAEVKASGGIRSLDDVNAMVAAGATRIGASSGVAIMEGQVSQDKY